MKFINYVKYRDLDKIASARTAHFAYTDRLPEQMRVDVVANSPEERANSIAKNLRTPNLT